MHLIIREILANQKYVQIVTFVCCCSINNQIQTKAVVSNYTHSAKALEELEKHEVNETYNVSVIF